MIFSVVSPICSCNSNEESPQHCRQLRSPLQAAVLSTRSKESRMIPNSRKKMPSMVFCIFWITSPPFSIASGRASTRSKSWSTIFRDVFTLATFVASSGTKRSHHTRMHSLEDVIDNLPEFRFHFRAVLTHTRRHCRILGTAMLRCHVGIF